MKIVHLKKADAESIYSALLECLKEKQLEVSKIIGIGFEGASTNLWKENWSPDKDQEGSTTRCTLSLSLTTVGMRPGS